MAVGCVEEAQAKVVCEQEAAAWSPESFEACESNVDVCDVETGRCEDTGTPRTTPSTEHLRTVRSSFTSPNRTVLCAGAVLAVCAGIVDVVAWLQLGSFVSHVSGNVAHIGMRVEGNHAGRDTPADLRESLALVLSFFLGAMICGMIIARNEVRFGKGLYGVALLGNAALLLLAMCLAPHEAAAYSLAAACGLQNGMCTMHFGAVFRTTHVTGIVTDMGTTMGRLLAILFRRRCRGANLDRIDRAEIEVDLLKLRVYLVLGLGFLLGAAGGAWLSRWFGLLALVVPGSVTGIGGTMYMLFRRSLMRQLARVERRRLGEEIKEVGVILERIKSMTASQFQEQDDMLGGAAEHPGQEGDQEDIMELDGQMRHALDLVRDLEGSLVVLNRRACSGDGAGVLVHAPPLFASTRGGGVSAGDVSPVTVLTSPRRRRLSVVASKAADGRQAAAPTPSPRSTMAARRAPSSQPSTPTPQQGPLHLQI